MQKFSDDFFVHGILTYHLAPRGLLFLFTQFRRRLWKYSFTILRKCINNNQSCFHYIPNACYMLNYDYQNQMMHVVLVLILNLRIGLNTKSL